MKDKRQRLAMTWPCDPAVYAYLVNAAAQHAAATASYPYVPAPALTTPPTPAVLPPHQPPPPPPFGYYSAGLQRVAAAAAAAAASSTPYRPLPVRDHAPYSTTTAFMRADRQRRVPSASPSPPVATTSAAVSNHALPGQVMSTSSSKTLFQPFKLDVDRS